MNNIFKAIGLGVVAGVVVGGYMAWKKGKEIQEKIDNTFDDEFVNNVVEKTTENLRNANEQMKERSKKVWEDLEETKKNTMDTIKARHEELDEEIKKMNDSQSKTIQTLEEIKEEAKAAVAELVTSDDNTNINKDQERERIEKLQAETEEQLDNLLADLNK
jgi:hypothetical protein